MLTQLNIYVLWAVFFSLSLGGMTHISDYKNTIEAICDDNLPGDSETHTKYEYTIDLFSSIELPSCENGNPRATIFWFWYNDICCSNGTRNKYFARVNTDNTIQCISRSELGITKDPCEKDYIFTRQSMIIKNITNSTSQKYVCCQPETETFMVYKSAVIYSINISDPTTVATTVITTTPSLTTSFSKTSSTINNSEAPSNSWILEILVPSIIGVVILITAVVIGFVFNKRRHRHQQNTAIQLKVST